MFENIPYKKKFFALIGLFVLLSITAYKRSFSKTIAAQQLVSESEEKLKVVQNSQHKIIRLRADVAYLDDIIGKESANPDVVQQELLNTFSTMESKAELVRLEEVHQSNNEYFNIYTNRIVFSGDFNALLKTTLEYEKAFEYSRVVSLEFRVEKEPRTRRKKLIEQLIFQNYEKIH